MALQKNRQINNIDVDYWKISGVNVTYTGEMAQVFVIGFQNADKRKEGVDKKVAFENYMVKDEDFNLYFATDVLDKLNPISSAYKFLKEKVGVFVDSVDV